MSSIEADKDETEEVEFISVCYIFSKFKMHCTEKKNPCPPLIRFNTLACILQEGRVPVLECIDLGSDSEDKGFSPALTATVSI